MRSKPAPTLTPAQFRDLTRMDPQREWFANLPNPRTRKAYRGDLDDFARFTGIRATAGFRRVARPHVIAWRESLRSRGLSPATVRRRLAALSAFFDHLCACNLVQGNPTRGVRRPAAETVAGKTPAISDAQARALLDAPDAGTLEGLRDRAVLATLLYHGLRRAELCGLKVGDLTVRTGLRQLRVEGKGGKVRYLPGHPEAVARIEAYLDRAGHAGDEDGPLFRPLRGSVRCLSGTTLYRRIVRRHALAAGVEVPGLCVHSLRVTAATNALGHAADIAQVQEWLGHAHIATTRLYDRRRSRPEESPTFRVAY